MNKLVLVACSSAASLLLVGGSVSANGNDDWQHAGNSLEGAWQVETTVRVDAEDCTTAPLVPPFAPNPFPSLYMFHEGGTMTEHGSRSPPSRRSTGFGVWERIGHHKYTYRNMFQSFDADGILVATMEFISELDLSKNGNTFTGVSRFVRKETSGTVLNFCATFSGERFTL